MGAALGQDGDSGLGHRLIAFLAGSDLRSSRSHVKKRRLHEGQPPGQYTVWVGVRAEAGVLARVSPSPRTV